MKNTYKILLTLVLIAGIYACDETINPTIYDGDASTNRTFLSFPSSVYNLPVAIDAQGSVTITLNASTKSSSVRTFNINLISEETTANPLTYTLPSTITIPANSYQGTLTIVGMDNNLVEPAAKQIVFNLAGLTDNDDIDEDKITVNVFEVCPIIAPFTGTYFMEQITPINPDDGIQMLEDQIVEVISTGDTSRSFSAVYLEAFGIGNGPTTFRFSLVCNEVIVDLVASTLLCVQGAPSINFGPANVPSTYVADDDSVFEVTISEYYTEDGGCGANPYDTTFRFTKQ